MNEYPDWLLEMVAKTIALSQKVAIGNVWDNPDWKAGKALWLEDATAVLDALNFAPDYKAYRRAGKNRMETDTWSGTVVSPAEQEKRREALDEILRFGREQEAAE